MKKSLLATAFLFSFAFEMAAQTTPALSNFAKNVGLEMSESALVAARPAAVKEDSTNSGPGEVWYSEESQDGNVSFLSFHVEKTGQHRLVGATIYFWEPNAEQVARLFFGDPTGADGKSWEVKNSTGKKVKVSIGEPTELLFELKK